MKNKISSLPLWPVIEELNQDDLCASIDSLNSLMPFVFRRPLSCAIHRRNSDGLIAELTMDAINPANGIIWHQTFKIYEHGGIGIVGGQQDAAWRWKWSYFNKCNRIIRYWLSEYGSLTKSKIRVQERAGLYASELMRRTATATAPAYEF
jgi:hypothetical protein